MLCDIPVVDGAVGVTSREYLHVATRILHIRLAVIDVVLMQGLLWLHHRVRVQLGTVEEHSAPSESVVIDPCCLGLTKARVE